MKVFREQVLALFVLTVIWMMNLPDAHAQCPGTTVDISTSSGFTFDFCGVDYDVGAGTSTWTYSLSWDGTPPALSHFTFELCSQATVSAVSPASYESIGPDPTTQLYGIKWDQSSFTLPQNISFTLDGLYSTGTVQWAPKSGTGDGVSPDSDWFLAQIAGPDINCGVVECVEDSQCADDSSCGIEVCDLTTYTCQSTPLDCSDGVSCTIDSCDPVTDTCSNTPDDSYCSDGAWCNGLEFCDAVADCQAGTAPECDDGVSCTVDACNDDTDSCNHIPDDSYCNDGKWCNGAETCDVAADCQAGIEPCALGEVCDEVAAMCTLPAEVSIDIKFCGDPNAFNCKRFDKGKSKGVLPVTIFGTEELDVGDIDANSLQLCLEDLSACTGAPVNWSKLDRGDPNSDLGAARCAFVDTDGDGNLEEQDFLNPDGFLDLDATFYASEVATVLGDFCDQGKGTVSQPLIVTGTTRDGTEIFSVPIPNAGVDQLVKVNK